MAPTLLERLDPSVAQALALTADPAQMVPLPIHNKMAPQRRDLDDGLSPPRNIHREQVAVRFTVETGRRDLHELDLTVFGIIGDDNNLLIIGIMTSEETAYAYPDEKVAFAARFVFILYSTFTKEGTVYVPARAVAKWRELQREDRELAKG